MAAYQFKGAGAAIPYDAFGHAVLRRRIDFAALVATDFGKLALTSAPTVGLSSFAGFAAADTLEIFSIPAGTLVDLMGFRIKTAGTATAKMSLGDDTSAAGWCVANLLDAAAETSYITLLTDAYGSSTMESKLYTAADGLDATFSVATVVLGVVDVYARVSKVY
jgi:hypothetical protein